MHVEDWTKEFTTICKRPHTLSINSLSQDFIHLNNRLRQISNNASGLKSLSDNNQVGLDSNKDIAELTWSFFILFCVSHYI